jgi:alkylation response protein AidB-like acyl-CoA dehydrogenase
VSAATAANAPSRRPLDLLALDSALEYARTRVLFGRPIAGFRLDKETLVDVRRALARAREASAILGARQAIMGERAFT